MWVVMALTGRPAADAALSDAALSGAVVSRDGQSGFLVGAAATALATVRSLFQHGPDTHDGAEVFGYDSAGWRVIPPLFSMRESATMKGVFGKVLTLVTGVLTDHGIAASSPGTLLEDRGAQVTVDFPVLGVSPHDQRAVLSFRAGAGAKPAGLRIARVPGPAGVLDYLVRDE